jgi:hypothetical protein
MSTSQLLLENLKDLDDGLLAAAFDANIRDVIRDLNDRPVDDRSRTVTMTLTFTPTYMGNDLDAVKLEHKVTSKIPGREGRECTLTPKRLGKDVALLFASNGTDARQPHLDFNEEID